MIYLKNIGYLDDVQNLHTVEVYNNGEYELNFNIPTDHKLYRNICEEMGLVYDGQDYVIKSIDEQNDIAVISCRIDIDALQANAVTNYREENQHLYTLMNFALTSTGWSYIGADRVSIRRTVELEGGNTLDLLRKAQEVYRCVFWYDTAKKEITVFPLDGFEYKGVYFTDELNTGKPLLRGDSFDFCTRLIPIGAEGLKIDDINGGKSYVENFGYSSKIITKVWKDERYTDVQSLKDDAIEKLKVLSNPNRTYSLDVIDLAAVNSEYSHLSFNVGDKVMLVDRSRNVKVEHQVARLITYPDNPQNNKAELSATAKGFESVLQNLTGMIDGTKVVIDIQGRRISQLTLDIEAFTLELANYYTRGETEIYVGSQIKAEASRIDLIVSEQTSRINDLSGEIETVGHNISELSLTVGGFDTRITNAEGQVSTLSQTVGGFDMRITNLYSLVDGFDAQITEAKEAAVSLSTEAFNVTLQNYSTTTQINTAITNQANATLTLAQDSFSVSLQSYSTTTEMNGTINSSANTVKTELRSEIQQKIDSLTLSVSNGSTSSTLSLKSGSTTLSSANITFTGFVTFTSLSSAGQTTINGGNLTTNSVTADKIYVTTLASISTDIGNVTAGSIPAGLIASGTLADARLSTNVVLLNNAQTVTGNKTFSGTTSIGALSLTGITTISGNISAGSQTVTPEQLGYVSGVTSNIQTQLNEKQASLPSGGNSGNWLRGDLTWQTHPAATITQIQLSNSVQNYIYTSNTINFGTSSSTNISISGNRITPNGTNSIIGTGSARFNESYIASMYTSAVYGGTGGGTSYGNLTIAAGTLSLYANSIPGGGFVLGTASSRVATIYVNFIEMASTLSGGTGVSLGTSTTRIGNGYFTNLNVTNFTVSSLGTSSGFIANAYVTTYNGGTSVTVGTSTTRVANGYFTNLNVTTLTVTTISGVTNLGSSSSRITNGYFTSLFATNLGSTSVVGTGLYVTGIFGGNTTTASIRLGAAQLGFYGVTPISRQTGWTNLSNTAWSTAERDRINAITTFLRTIGLTT
ncbi:MAG: phage tail protein [Oscillospiraceae bacterium]|nr:phage tail protein [Oscillospiraceae bacterium]